MGSGCHKLNQTGTEISDQRNIGRNDQMVKNFQNAPEGLTDRFFQYVHRDMKPVFNPKAGAKESQQDHFDMNQFIQPGDGCMEGVA